MLHEDDVLLFSWVLLSVVIFYTYLMKKKIVIPMIHTLSIQTIKLVIFGK